MDTILATVVVGVGATLFLDAWNLLRTRVFRTPAPNFGFIGRWVGHFASGRFRHDSIAAATPVRGELALGWLVHYAIGVAFAALLVAVAGTAWLARPTPLPALAVGIATVAAPFLVMQPGMGLGIAGSRTPRPGVVRRNSLVNHAVFGVGMYATAWLLAAAPG